MERSPAKRGGEARGAQSTRERPQTNEHGGVKLADVEIEQAFRFLARGREVLTGEDLQRALGEIMPAGEASDMQCLVGEEGLTLAKLRDLLAENQLRGEDPYADALGALDPNGDGFADPEALRKALEAVPSVGRVTDEEVARVVEAFDADGDGRIGMSDYDAIFPSRR